MYSVHLLGRPENDHFTTKKHPCKMDADRGVPQERPNPKAGTFGIAHLTSQRRSTCNRSPTPHAAW
jgi:hypothetical protein